MSYIIPTGSTVSCASCGTTIATIRFDVKSDDPIALEDMWFPGNRLVPRPNDPVRCPNCHSCKIHIRMRDTETKLLQKEFK